MKILIVGGNAAGCAAAAKAKRLNPKADVILFEQSPFISTGTCELPYVISNEIDSWKKIVFFDEISFKNEKGVDVFINTKVLEILPAEKKIKTLNLNDNSFSLWNYDKLIIAVGSKSKRIFNENYKNLFYLKNVQDLIEVKDFLNKYHCKQAVIFGGGYIGLELAEALKKIALSVCVVEREKYPLPSCEIETSNLILSDLIKNEITFIGDAKNISIKSENDFIKEINIDKTFSIKADIVFCSIGFEPNVEIAKKAGIKLGKTGAIEVDGRMKTSFNDIYAAGDCVETTEFISKTKIYLPLASIAREQGYIAAANATGKNEIFDPQIKNVTVKIFNRYCGAVGLSSKELYKLGYNFSSAKAVAYQIIKVMPDRRKIFGKILYEKISRKILGANFYGGPEIAGYCDIIASLIYSNQKIDALVKINFNYTPPLSPFANILTIIGKKTSSEN